MDKEAEQVPVGANRLLYLPYLMGERTPHLDPGAQRIWTVRNAHQAGYAPCCAGGRNVFSAGLRGSVARNGHLRRRYDGMRRRRYFSAQTTQNASIAASADEETLLAALVQCEAGGTSVQCMTAVGAVVVNRVRSGGFANSIYGVIYQRGQFGPASSGRLEARLASGVSASARQAARAALNGSDPTGGAKYFKLASSGHAGTVVGPIVFY